MNILVVDDEKEIADLIELYLKMKIIRCLSFIMVVMLCVVSKQRI